MKKLIGSYLLLTLMSFTLASVASALEQNPDNIIASASERLLFTLNQERSQFKNNPQRLYSRVSNQMRPLSDFSSIARGVMGSFYKTADAEQKRRFTTAFQQSLIRIFSNSLMSSKINNIKVVPVTNINPASRKRNVSMIVSTAGGDRFQVNYSMVRNAQNKWLIRNVILDGVNLGLTYRNQFKSEMNRSGNNLNHVIANWSKVAKQ
jgi:phospholipid transport system substrate-binding protein